MGHTILRLALAAGMTAALASADNAVAAEPIIVRESMAGVVIHNDCAGEDVVITDGEVMFLLLEHGNDGRAIETFHTSKSDVTGTGTTSGTTYRAAQTSIGQFDEGFDGTTQNVAVSHLTLVGTGGSGVATVTTVVVWRSDEDGFHLATEQLHATCST